MYRFAYNYTRSAMDNPAQKSIDKQSAMMMLRVLLGRRWSQLPRFFDFLKVRARDAGCAILRGCAGLTAVVPPLSFFLYTATSHQDYQPRPVDEHPRVFNLCGRQL